MELKKEWIETILKKKAQDRSVAKVISATTESVVSKGDNYASDMSRVKMEVIYGSGKKENKSLILKTLPDTEMRAKHINEWGVFKKEIKMYTEILPQMEDLLEEIGDKSEPLWGQCLEYKPYTRIIFEDLKEYGYIMADKRKGLDLVHVLLVVKSLAKFHALSAKMKESGLLEPNEFKDVLYTRQPEMMQAFHNNCLTSLSYVIETTWEPEYKPFVEMLRNLIGKSYWKILELFKSEESQFNILCHGDCWVNNMMFKYNSGSTQPISLRFVDFQMCYYNVPGMDLQNFLTTSVQNEIREKYLDEVLSVYHEALLLWLRKFGFKGKEPTLEEVYGWLEKTNFFGFFLSITGLPVMILEPEDVPNIEELLKDFENDNLKPDYKAFLGKPYTKRIKFLLKYFQERGIFG